jgi:flavin-dependent dehydrogenase
VASAGDPDVLVVGGGPAGCAAAISGALRGLRVALIHRPERAAYRPGETLPPALEPLLRQLGAEDSLLGPGFPRTSGHNVSWGRPETFVAYGEDDHGPWLGFHASRRALDRGLQATARGAGVSVTETGARVTPLVDDGRVAGARVGPDEIRAHLVVDAAGASHWLARELGLELRRESQRLVVRYGLVAGEAAGQPSLVADEHGWTWIAPVEDGSIAWVRLPFRPEEASATGVPSELAHLPQRSRVGGADVTWRRVTPVAGPGYMLVGDAAFVLDPVSSHGVLHAVMSGMMAAAMAGKSLREGVPEEATAAAYRRWSTGRFSTDVARLRALYADLAHAEPIVAAR